MQNHPKKMREGGWHTYLKIPVKKATKSSKNQQIREAGVEAANDEGTGPL